MIGPGIRIGIEGLPPFMLTRGSLSWLAHMAEVYGDGAALRLLWWQASIGPDGINERLRIEAMTKERS